MTRRRAVDRLVATEDLDAGITHVMGHRYVGCRDDGKPRCPSPETPFMIDLVDEQFVPHPTHRFERVAWDDHA